MAKLVFNYGAMGSSKTANALMVAYNYEERGQHALILKPATLEMAFTPFLQESVFQTHAA